MSLIPQIEAILFVASKPIRIKDIAKSLKQSENHILDAIETMQAKYNHDESGIHIIVQEDMVQMATNPDCATSIEGFTKYDIAGELTKAQLESLTVIAYIGPVSRPELEEIRGVNCAIIIRNLLVRGLIEEQKRPEDLLHTYILSVQALAHLGVTSVEELPEYTAMNQHEYILSTKTTA